MKFRITHRIMCAAALASLVLAIGQAHADSALPPVQHSGPVAYLSGGVGSAESSAIQDASKHWPLTLEFAIQTPQGAEYAADVDVQLTDANGQTTLATRSQGPFLLAQLAPGSYRVNATLAGKTLHQQLHIVAGQPAKAVLVWPAGTDKAPA